MAAAAEEFGQTTSSLDGTQVFTPQYASAFEHEYGGYEAQDAAASGPPHQFGEGEEDAAGFDEGDPDGEELEQLDDEQLWDESQRDHARVDSAIVQSSKLSAQDYIPKKLVGHTYGSESWQLHRPPNPLAERQAYVRTGSNGVFEVRPAVLTFEGFHVGNAYTQHVSLVNVSGRSQRLHLLPTTSGAFRMSCNKKGLVAPGMAEQLTVRFEPTEYRYYSDCVRIHVLGENLLLPLHAFPVLNAAGHVFPSRIDMGAVAVGQRLERKVQLVCDVPVQFEFRLSPLNPGPDFSVFPQEGIVPANGSTWVTIEYSPTRAVTSTLQLQVDVSQLGFKPFVCTVTGHSHVLQQNVPIAQPHKQTQSLRQKRMAASAHLSAIMPAALAAPAPSRLRPPAAASASAMDRPKAAGTRK